MSSDDVGRVPGVTIFLNEFDDPIHGFPATSTPLACTEITAPMSSIKTRITTDPAVLYILVYIFKMDSGPFMFNHDN